MCRNRMCENLGVLYGSEASGVDPRYGLVREEKSGEITGIVCRYCTAETSSEAVHSIRRIARHFLAESLPVAEGPIEDCENHGRSAFECLPQKARAAPRQPVSRQ